MKLIIKRADGGISITNLSDRANVEEEVEKLKPMLPEGYVSHRVMPDDAVPVDRTFRNAWCDETPELIVDIDMVKAREIHKRRFDNPPQRVLDAIEIARTPEQLKVVNDTRKR